MLTMRTMWHKHLCNLAFVHAWITLALNVKSICGFISLDNSQQMELIRTGNVVCPYVQNGIPDKVAAAGKIFKYKIPNDAFSGNYDMLWVMGDGKNTLPKWIYYDQSEKELWGVPTSHDIPTEVYLEVIAGIVDASGHLCQNVSDIFRISVVTWSQNQPYALSEKVKSLFLPPKQEEKLVKHKVKPCSSFVQTTLIFAVSLDHLNAKGRLNAVNKLTDFLSINVSAVTLSSGSDVLLKLGSQKYSIVTSGPGNTDSVVPDAMELTWQVACGMFRELHNFIQILQHNIEGGRLTKEIGYKIIGWYISSATKSTEQNHIRNKRRVQFSTPTPTPSLHAVPFTKMIQKQSGIHVFPLSEQTESSKKESIIDTVIQPLRPSQTISFHLESSTMPKAFNTIPEHDPHIKSTYLESSLSSVTSDKVLSSFINSQPMAASLIESSPRQIFSSLETLKPSISVREAMDSDHFFLSSECHNLECTTFSKKTMPYTSPMVIKSDLLVSLEILPSLEFIKSSHPIQIPTSFSEFKLESPLRTMSPGEKSTPELKRKTYKQTTEHLMETRMLHLEESFQSVIPTFLHQYDKSSVVSDRVEAQSMEEDTKPFSSVSLQLVSGTMDDLTTAIITKGVTLNSTAKMDANLVHGIPITSTTESLIEETLVVGPSLKPDGSATKLSEEIGALPMTTSLRSISEEHVHTALFPSKISNASLILMSSPSQDKLVLQSLPAEHDKTHVLLVTTEMDSGPGSGNDADVATVLSWMRMESSGFTTGIVSAHSTDTFMMSTRAEYLPSGHVYLDVNSEENFPESSSIEPSYFFIIPVSKQSSLRLQKISSSTLQFGGDKQHIGVGTTLPVTTEHKLQTSVTSDQDEETHLLVTSSVIHLPLSDKNLSKSYKLSLSLGDTSKEEPFQADSTEKLRVTPLHSFDPSPKFIAAQTFDTSFIDSIATSVLISTSLGMYGHPHPQSSLHGQSSMFPLFLDNQTLLSPKESKDETITERQKETAAKTKTPTSVDTTTAGAPETSQKQTDHTSSQVTTTSEELTAKLTTQKHLQSPTITTTRLTTATAATISRKHQHTTRVPKKTTSEQRLEVTTVITSKLPELWNNKNPVVINPINHAVAYVGQDFYFQIPRDTFNDAEDGDTRHLTLSVAFHFERKPPSRHWLYFDESNQVLMGIPLQRDLRHNPLKTTIFAADSGNRVAQDVMEIYINSSSSKELSHKFTMKFSLHGKKFMSDRKNLKLLLNRLGSYFGDPDSSFITVISARPGSLILTWSNNTLSTNQCQNETIWNLYQKLHDDNKGINPNLFQYMLPKYQVSSVTMELLGICLVTEIPETESSTSVTVTESGEPEVDAWAEAVIPTVIAVTIAIFIVVVILLICSRKQRNEKNQAANDERQSFGEERDPVIFPADRETQDRALRPKQAMVLPGDGKPRVAGGRKNFSSPLPGYQRTGFEITDNEPVQSNRSTNEPPAYSAAGSSSAPPPYRLPPPYFPESGSSYV